MVHKHILTSERLKSLEARAEIRSALRALAQNKLNLSETEAKGLAILSEIIKAKSQEAISPLSKAQYAALTVFNLNSEDIQIHLGANIDPPSADLKFSVPHRNCAEKQSVLSAAMHDQSLANLDILFLYREPSPDRVFTAEKLIPCADCKSKYVHQLIRNDGKLVLILDDDKPMQFVTKDELAINNVIKTVSVNGAEVHYKVLDSEQMHFLKVEDWGD